MKPSQLITFSRKTSWRFVCPFLVYPIQCAESALWCPKLNPASSNTQWFKGYLRSKLYQILKGQALSCLVFLRCEPSNMVELYRGKHFVSFSYLCFNIFSDWESCEIVWFVLNCINLQGCLDQNPHPPWWRVTNRGNETQKQKHYWLISIKGCMDSRYAHKGQHRHSAASTDPDGEEDNQKGGWKHHLTGVGCSVSDGKCKGHRSTQAWRTQKKLCGEKGCLALLESVWLQSLCVNFIGGFLRSWTAHSEKTHTLISSRS